MERPIGFGIVGCNNIAAFHGKAIATTSGAQLIACADVSVERAGAFGRQYGAKAWFTDYQEMLKRDDIDAVCICTPSGTHSMIAVAAAQARKHVLVEKPLDVRMDKVKVMIEAAHENRVKLGGIFQMRTYPSVQKVRQAVQSGQLGKMVLGDAFLKYHRNQAYYDQAQWRGTWELDGGGALMNQGIHGIDLLQWIMGDVESVYAQCATLVRRIEVEDTAVVQVKYKNGALGVIEGTTSVYPGWPSSLVLHGESGTIVLEDHLIRRFVTTAGESKDLVEDGSTWGAANDPTQIDTRGHEIQIEDFVSAICDDREPMVNGEEASRAVQLILAVYQSAATKQEVRVADVK